MGDLLSCSSRLANVPYNLENTSSEVYSLEELCYFYQNNPLLLDMAIINEDFCGWVGNELGLTVLSHRLNEICKNKGPLALFMKEILDATDFLNDKEEEELLGDLSQVEVENEIIRRKKQGDKLYLGGRYTLAIMEYRRILLSDGIEKETQELRGNIWHNLGCAYGMLFLYEEAEYCFQMAFPGNGNLRSQDGIVGAQFLQNHEFTGETSSMDREAMKQELNEIKEAYRKSAR